MRAVTGLWRWRCNPLRRSTDLAEAWVALVALLLLCCAAPAVGWVCGGVIDDSLRRAVRTQHEQRHPGTARVLSPAERPAHSVRDPESTRTQHARRSVVATWTAPDGTARTGTVATTPELADAGDTFRVWTDDRGRVVGAPMDPEAARAHAVLGGVAAALAAGGVVEGARRLVVWRLVRRRYARLDRAWAQAGPDWGRTGTGS